MLVRPLWSQLLVAELTKHSKHKLSHIESVSGPLKSCSQPICCTIGQWWFIGCCPLLVVAGSCWAKWKLMKQMQQLPTGLNRSALNLDRSCWHWYLRWCPLPPCCPHIAKMLYTRLGASVQVCNYVCHFVFACVCVCVFLCIYVQLYICVCVCQHQARVL